MISKLLITDYIANYVDVSMYTHNINIGPIFKDITIEIPTSIGFYLITYDKYI